MIPAIAPGGSTTLRLPRRGPRRVGAGNFSFQNQGRFMGWVLPRRLNHEPISPAPDEGRHDEGGKKSGRQAPAARPIAPGEQDAGAHGARSSGAGTRDPFHYGGR